MRRLAKACQKMVDDSMVPKFPKVVTSHSKNTHRSDSRGRCADDGRAIVGTTGGTATIQNKNTATTTTTTTTTTNGSHGGSRPSSAVARGSRPHSRPGSAHSPNRNSNNALSGSNNGGGNGIVRSRPNSATMGITTAIVTRR